LVAPLVPLFWRWRAHERCGRGRHRGPALLTACIALTLLAWSAYALSGAGVIGALPMRKAALTAITGIYLARGLAILPLACVARFRLSTFWSGARPCAWSLAWCT